MTYGRIDRRGRSLTYSAPDDKETATIVRQCLKRRATAPKRIGVSYKVRELCDPKEWSAINL
ncbi:MAG: hypothetical protein AB7T38_18030 [Nitrospirales bacterium]